MTSLRRWHGAVFDHPMAAPSWSNIIYSETMLIALGYGYAFKQPISALVTIRDQMAIEALESLECWKASSEYPNIRIYPNIPNGDVIRVTRWFRKLQKLRAWDGHKMSGNIINDGQRLPLSMEHVEKCSSAGIVCEPKFRKGPRSKKMLRLIQFLFNRKCNCYVLLNEYSLRNHTACNSKPCNFM